MTLRYVLIHTSTKYKHAGPWGKIFLHKTRLYINTLGLRQNISSQDKIVSTETKYETRILTPPNLLPGVYNEILPYPTSFQGFIMKYYATRPPSRCLYWNTFTFSDIPCWIGLLICKHKIIGEYIRWIVLPFFGTYRIRSYALK